MKARYVRRPRLLVEAGLAWLCAVTLVAVPALAIDAPSPETEPGAEGRAEAQPAPPSKAQSEAQSEAQSKAQSEAQPGPPAGIWNRFESEQGRFSVLVPAEPLLLERITSTVVGRLEERKYEVGVGAGLYSVGTHDLPSIAMFLAPTGVVFSETRDKILAGTGGRELAFVERDFDGHPGRVLVYALENAPFAIEEVRMILVGKRLYLLTAGRPAADSDRSLMDRFFDSFELLKKGRKR